MPSFQYISDIHLEFRETPPVLTPLADVLLLGGDIGNPTQPIYREFLRTVSRQFKQVFLIAGNHEYYGPRYMNETLYLLDLMCEEFPNVIFLHDAAHQVLDTDVWIFGTTLWSDIPTDPAITAQVRSTMADYRRIPHFTPAISSELYANAIDHFKEIRGANGDGEETKKRWLVLCHHLPSMHLIDPKYAVYSALNHAFASNATELTESAVAVVYGHTHTPYRSGKFYCNPLGYPGENPMTNPNASFSL